MRSGFDSEWFEAVNDGTRIELVQGVARTRLSGDGLLAELFGSDGALHGTLRGSVNEETAKIIGSLERTSDGGGEIPLRGYYFQPDEDEKPDLRTDENISIIVTDGWTTVGISLPGRGEKS